MVPAPHTGEGLRVGGPDREWDPYPRKRRHDFGGAGLPGRWEGTQVEIRVVDIPPDLSPPDPDPVPTCNTSVPKSPAPTLGPLSKLTPDSGPTPRVGRERGRRLMSPATGVPYRLKHQGLAFGEVRLSTEAGSRFPTPDPSFPRPSGASVPRPPRSPRFPPDRLPGTPRGTGRRAEDGGASPGAVG